MLSPEEAAGKVLSDVGWDGSLPINPTVIAKCYDIGVERDDAFAGGTNSGKCVNLESGGRVILINPSDSTVRQRFTIAHELGHALMHSDGVHERNGGKSYNANNYRIIEVQANRFAAALLMPADLVTEAFQSGMDLAKLAEAFAVSQTAMRIRLETLGHI